MSSDKPKKTGVRFWLPALTDSPDPLHRYADEPYPSKKGASFTPTEYRNQAYKIHIRGEAWFDKSGTVLLLAAKALDEAKCQGKSGLRFNPQQAVDSGLVTVDQLAELGFVGLQPRAGAPEPKKDEPKPAEDKKPEPAPEPAPASARVPTQPDAPVAKLEEPLPDFDVLSLVELREWADKNGVFLDGRWGKETSVSKLRDELKKRGK